MTNVNTDPHTVPDESPFVSIVVINYNGGQYVLNCIQSLLQTTYSHYKVSVLDNASQDSSADDIRNTFPDVEVIKLNTNVGYAGGVNYAMDLFHYEYIVILNNDIYVDHDWLRKLIATAEANPMAIMIGPRVLNTIDGTTSFAGAYLTFPVIGSNIIYANGQKYSGLLEPSYAAGALFMLRRHEALLIGSFDSDYFLNWEEIDFAWRAWLCGYRVLMNLDACVYHDGGKSTKGILMSRRMSFLSHKNRIMTYNKYLSNRPLLMGAFGEIICGSRILVNSISGGGPKANCRLQGYLLAILWILKNLRVVYGKRLYMKRRCKYWGLLPPGTKASKMHFNDFTKYILKQ